MLDTILKPLTTASTGGVVLRYLITIISSMVAILSILGVLSPDQVASITAKVEAISGQLPGLIAAISGLIAIGVPIYAAATKSSSDKAAEAAKQIDKQIPPSAPVEIVTPGSAPNIVVTSPKT